MFRVSRNDLSGFEYDTETHWFSCTYHPKYLLGVIEPLLIIMLMTLANVNKLFLMLNVLRVVL